MAHHDQYLSLVVLVVGLGVWVRECVYAVIKHMLVFLIIPSNSRYSFLLISISMPLNAAYNVH